MIKSTLRIWCETPLDDVSPPPPTSSMGGKDEVYRRPYPSDPALLRILNSHAEIEFKGLGFGRLAFRRRTSRTSWFICAELMIVSMWDVGSPMQP